jgi:hypothetical protein
MKKTILFLIIIFILLGGCKEVKLPTSSNPIEPIEPPPKTAAQISYYDYNLNFYPDINQPRKAEWRIWGWLRNSGDLPAKNIKIHSKIYNINYDVLWQGEFLFINPLTNSSYLNGKGVCEFIASWKGLDISIFTGFDENGKPLNSGGWDYIRTLNGIKITWE